MKEILLGMLMFCCLATLLSAQESGKNHYIKVTKPEYIKSDNLFNMGTAINPAGKSIVINSKSLIIDGKPVVPVMGEIHYARIPENEWKKELLKMKAGGINIIASYIFWIHHEETEGKFDWTGQRNLHKFVQLCQELDLLFVLRVGPWCHGECRNGGLPEWLVTGDVKMRENNPAYLGKVQIWFEQLFEQVNGLMWKDNGPVIGVQIENEFGGRAEHLITLKQMLQRIGFDVPLYTRTGWPKLSSSIPFGEIIPLYGDYPDGFWDRSIEELTGDYAKGYSFRTFRSSTVIATEQLPKQSGKDNLEDLVYPYFTCELGGGMMPGYHRRISIDPMDVYAMALVKVGSGSNLPGYYMYHGGTNPDGKTMTFNEEQASHFTNYNDLPVKTYDFQAPLGEFGQVNPHYHTLRLLHLFLSDFGGELTSMDSSFPEKTSDSDSLRWVVRSNGESGYLFVNNYQRLTPMSAKKNVRFSVDLSGKELVFPEKPFTVTSGASSFMPFNMNVGDARMIYSTAQPLSKLEDGNEMIYVFARNREIVPEFVFDENQIKLKSSNVKPQQRDGRFYFKNVKTGTDDAISFYDQNNKLIRIVLLDENTSLSFWKGKLAGKDRLFLTSSNLTFHKNQLELTNNVDESFVVSVFPAPQNMSYQGKFIKGKSNGIFTEYKVNMPTVSNITAGFTKVKEADLPLREIKNGNAGVAEQPADEDFNKAAVWKITLPNDIDAARDIYLQLNYVGDVARIYLDGKLLTDNFYNGKDFYIGLKRFGAAIYKGELVVKVLPFQRDALIYLPVRKQMEAIKSEAPADIYTIKAGENVTITLEAVDV